MTTFVDTSALYALLDRDDANHSAAKRLFASLRPADRLVTHSYVLVETTALVQSRMGVGAVRSLTYDLIPRLDVTWVDASLHSAAVKALLADRSRGVSLVDRVSFEIMLALGIRRAFAFDPNFAKEGFEVLPEE